MNDEITNVKPDGDMSDKATDQPTFPQTGDGIGPPDPDFERIIDEILEDDPEDMGHDEDEEGEVNSLDDDDDEPNECEDDEDVA